MSKPGEHRSPKNEARRATVGCKKKCLRCRSSFLSRNSRTNWLCEECALGNSQESEDCSVIASAGASGAKELRA